MMKITAVQIDPPKLHKTIVTHFSLDELRDLCFDLGLDSDELPPGGKSAKARGLVEMCQRQRRLVDLAEAALEQRPNISRNEFLRDIANDDAPFKGMLAFEEADEEIFFGRETLTAELAARVHQPPAGSFPELDQMSNLREVSPVTNFLAIVGASGSGKSSVVRAGMIPQLRRQTNWPIHLITPTAHPLQALATSLTRDSESVTATATLQANLTFEGGLVDILLRDVGAADNQTPEPGALPLLSHALLETWQRRNPSENRLTLAGYTEAGGVQGAIAKTAESTYQRLSADQQKIARSIFLRLTELGEGTQDTRRRATLTELLPQDDTRATVEQVLKTLADTRLLTTSEDGAEVAHEALIRQWPTLQSWLDEDREGLRLHRQLTEAAQAWQANDREPSYLFRGGRLEQTNEWVSQNDAHLNQLETDFLAASQKFETDELTRVQAVATERTRASRVLRIALFIADIFAIAFLVFLLQAQENARILARQQQAALAQSAAALANVVLEQDNNTELATLLTVESARVNWNSNGNVDWLIDNNLRSYLATQRFFNNSLTGHEFRVNSVAFSPDGDRLASGSDDGTIWLWDMADPSVEPVVLTGHRSSVLSVAFSPDGSWLASGSEDRTIRLWALADGAEGALAEPVVLTGHEGRVRSVAFSPDGDSLASGGDDGTIRVWIFLEELVDIGCQKVRRNLSWEEWQRYLPGEPYRQTCPNLPPHPSVPASELP